MVNLCLLYFFKKKIYVKSSQNASVMMITITLPIRPTIASLPFLVHPFFTDMIPIYFLYFYMKLNLSSVETPFNFGLYVYFTSN